jgi:hypothetical protein
MCCGLPKNKHLRKWFLGDPFTGRPAVPIVCSLVFPERGTAGLAVLVLLQQWIKEPVGSGRPEQVIYVISSAVTTHSQAYRVHGKFRERTRLCRYVALGQTRAAGRRRV